jgi:NADH:ubiquinone oxidoreductase subunit F (NADH-binding)
MTRPAVLAGPDLNAGWERLADHGARLGPLPSIGAAAIELVERSGLRGRGGAAFPAGVKWRTVHGSSRGDAVVLVNGAEGEPLSRKDRVLMETRPHLVLDGAALAADAVGARDVVLYVGAEHRRAADALQRALAERGAHEWRRTTLVAAPPRYVSGEETAAVHFLNEGVALPTTRPPRPFERGVDARPTLVQNVETLAHAALIARFGDAWFREGGTSLLTVSGAVESGGVVEVPHGSGVAAAVSAAGGFDGDAHAVLLGGYFGGWVSADEAWSVSRVPGCGVVAVLPRHRCGVVETARIVAWLADQSARQCGPCVFGLRAIADALGRIARGASVGDDLDRIRRWAGELPGRGACRHPDGAAALVASALQVFAEEFAVHRRRGRCTATSAGTRVAA